MARECSVDGCERAMRVRGYCDKHARQFPSIETLRKREEAEPAPARPGETP